MVLYYVHDPMCSWCWGFRPNWQHIQSQLPSTVEVKYLLGGLAPDSDVVMPESMQRDIAGYWKKIQQHIPDTLFNFDFWKNNSPRRSTYPACRAVMAARKQRPEAEKLMIEAIQTAYYLNAQNPSDDDVLITLARGLSLNEQRFKQDLNHTDTQTQLEKEILFSQQIGAQGFPSMILQKTDTFYPLPLDYNQPDSALAFIQDIKKSPKA